MLTFVAQRWAYFVLLAYELVLVLAFLLMLVLTVLQPGPDLETDKDTWLVIYLLLAIMPSLVCALQLFSAELRRHFGLHASVNE